MKKKSLFDRISSQAKEKLNEKLNEKVIEKFNEKFNEQFQAAQTKAEELFEQTRKSARKTLQTSAKKAASQVGDTFSRTVVNSFKRSARDAVASVKESGAEFKAYLESEEFENDLDTLAKRLGKFDGTYENFAAETASASKNARLLRVHSKARFLFKECREDVLKQATRKIVIFEIPINPRLAVALALIFSGVKTTEIILHGIEVFAPKKKAAKVIRIR